MKFKESENVITIKNYKNCFIYFLIKDKDVVYVGQTKKGLVRPFSHQDKDFDEIKMMCCEENELDLKEDEYIKKYSPIFNKQRNYAVQWSLSRVRNCIRQATGISNYSIPKLKKVLIELGITAEKDIYTDGYYISFDDYEKVMRHIKGEQAMATGKRYYWIKLKESFMTSDTVDYLMSVPNGANYVVLYQMLCLKTINTEGRLSRQIGEILIPYDVDKIQRDCKWFSADTIRVALNLYRSFGLIYEDQDGTLVLTDHNNLVGSETDYAGQKRMQRQDQPYLPSVDNVHINVHENVHTDIRDKDIRDKETDIEQETTRVPAREVDGDEKTNALEDLFNEFWKEYPKKVDKAGAYRAFRNIKCIHTKFPAIMESLKKYKTSEGWTKANGSFIPYPTTWIHQERWNDVDEIVKETQTQEFASGSFDTDDFVAAALARTERMFAERNKK